MNDLVSKHVRAIQRQITLNGVPPDSYAVGSWEEWQALREELIEREYQLHGLRRLCMADADHVNFLLCGVPCVPEPVPLVWDPNGHILIQVP